MIRYYKQKYGRREESKEEELWGRKRKSGKRKTKKIKKISSKK